MVFSASVKAFGGFNVHVKVTCGVVKYHQRSDSRVKPLKVRSAKEIARAHKQEGIEEDL